MRSWARASVSMIHRVCDLYTKRAIPATTGVG